MTQRRNRQKDKHRWRPGRRHRYVAWAGVIACTGLLVTGILLLVGGIREWHIESASVNWPMTQAEITRSEEVRAFPVPRRRAIAFARYEREVSVRYSLNGVEYTANFKLPDGALKIPTPNPPQSGFSHAANIEYI